MRAEQEAKSRLERVLAEGAEREERLLRAKNALKRAIAAALATF